METNGNEPISYIPKQQEYDRGINGNIGLTKREYFAALAMQGILSSQTERDAIGYPIDFLYVVNNSVLIADALINELNKEK